MASQSDSRITAPDSYYFQTSSVLQLRHGEDALPGKIFPIGETARVVRLSRWHDAGVKDNSVAVSRQSHPLSLSKVTAHLYTSSRSTPTVVKLDPADAYCHPCRVPANLGGSVYNTFGSRISEGGDARYVSRVYFGVLAISDGAKQEDRHKDHRSDGSNIVSSDNKQCNGNGAGCQCHARR